MSPQIKDSLQQQLLVSKQDSNRVLLLHSLFYTILFSKPDSAMYVAQEGLRLAESIAFLKGQALCKADIGGVWWIIGDYPKATEAMLESLKIAESINDPLAISWALAFLTSNNRDQGNYNEALKYALRGAARHMFSERLWNVIVASVYEQMNKLDSALYYAQRGDSGDYNFLILGHTYARMGRSDLAAKYYKKATSALSERNNLKDLADAYIGLAKLFQKENIQDSAIYYAGMGFALAQNSSFKKWVYETSLILSKSYENTDAKKALYYYKLAMTAKDSMFNIQKATETLSARYSAQLRLRAAESEKMSFRNKIRTYTLLGVTGFFLLLAIILYRNNGQKQKAKAKIEKAYSELKTTQSQLIQSEKMASLGELTAGIAHEIQNPLNFVNNFSDVNNELVDEAKQEIKKGNIADVETILNDIKANEEKINHHGKRADAIVKGMLQHSRNSTGQREPTDINALCDEYLRLAYHGLRARDKTFNAEIKTNFDLNIGRINIVPQDIGRVLLNLINNAFYALSEKAKENVPGYEPTVIVRTCVVIPPLGGQRGAEISVKDNGNGIPGSIKDKIFQPFFTTKPTGQGTGLGLSLVYDIVKAHGGEIKVETKEGEGTEFIILLPYS